MSLKPILPGNLLQVPSGGTGPVILSGPVVNVPGHGWFPRIGGLVQIEASGPPPPPAPVITSITPGVDGANPILTFDFTSAQWDLFNYEYATDAGFLTGIVAVSLIPGTVGGTQEINPTIPAPLLPNTQYWVRMKIQLGGVDSDWSNVVTATTSGAFIGLITHTAAATVNGSSVTTTPIDTTGCDFLVIFVSGFAGSGIVVSDNKSNIWTPLTFKDGGSVRGQLFYSVPTSVGFGHTFFAQSSFPSIFMMGFFRVNAVPFNQESGNSTGSATSIQPGAITPAVNGSLLVCGLGIYNASPDPTIDSGFSVEDIIAFGPGMNFGGAFAFFVQSSAASINPTWNFGSSGASAVMGSFEPT